VKLLFKASPLFTIDRQKRIIHEVDAFCSYLDGIGFTPPREFPPLGVWPGKVSGTRGEWYTGRPTIYDNSLIMGQEKLDDRTYIRALYSQYIFREVLYTAPTDKHDAFLYLSAQIFQNYYLADFTNIPPSAPRRDAPTGKWISAMWDIRQKYGREFANKILFYAFKQWNHPLDDVNKEDFDRFFGLRFNVGLDIEDNMGQNAASIDEILKRDLIRRP
jgi:hypothetical protein